MTEMAATNAGTEAHATATGATAGAPKRRKLERRERLRKSALCKHFDKPGGCPFPNCKFAHGRDEVADPSVNAVAAQRQLIREQVVRRAEGRFQAQEGPAAGAQSLRGTMIERYYTEMFSCDTMGKPAEDQYVHMHSNRLCVVGVAASHPLMRAQVERVEFTPNVLESRVSGKKKKGGSFLLPHTILCHVHCVGGTVFALRSCIRGTLLEFNDRLQDQPALLLAKHLSEGYLAIVQPKQVEVAEIQASLLSKDEYAQFRAISAVQAETNGAAIAAAAASTATAPSSSTATAAVTAVESSAAEAVEPNEQPCQ